MPKFNIGDRVVYSHNIGGSWFNEQHGTVMTEEQDIWGEIRVMIRFDNQHPDHTKDFYCEIPNLRMEGPKPKRGFGRWVHATS